MAAKKGDTDSAKILAKEVVNARKSVAKIYTAKANLGSIEMQIKQQVILFRFLRWSENVSNFKQVFSFNFDFEIRNDFMDIGKNWYLKRNS